MKVPLTFILFYIICDWLPAQSVNLGFNSTDSGRNVSLQYENSQGSSEFSYGLCININNFHQIEMRSDLYRKKLYATKGYHFVGLNFTYHRYISIAEKSCLIPFIFYDSQTKYSTAAFLSTIVEYDSTLVQTRPEQGIVGRQVLDYFGPFFWFENNIGIGFRAMLTDRFYIKQRFGLGVNLILGHDDQILYRRFSWLDWEFSTLIHFSVGYRFKKKSS